MGVTTICAGRFDAPFRIRQVASAMRLVVSLFLVLASFDFHQVQAQSQEDWKLLPREVNLRQELEALQVNFRQQGMRNACAAFSATAMLELQLRRLGYNFDLSEQYVLWATQEEGAIPSRGLTNEELVNGLKAHRVCREEFMPYKSSVDIIEPSAEAKADAAQMPPVRAELIAYASSPGLSDAQLYRICQALARYEPVCFSAFWLKDGVELGKNYVMESDEVDLGLGHMVLLTGYELTGNGEGYLLLRNSWGLNWGDFGYARMPFDYARKYGLDAISFSFDWTPQPQDSAKETQQESEEPPPPGLSIYFVSLLGIYAVAGLLGFGLPALLFAPEARSPFKWLFYLVAMVALLMLFGVVVENLIAHYAVGDQRTAGLLGVGILGLLLICVRLPMRQFEIGFGRGLLLVIVGMLIFWPAQLATAHWLPVTAYQEWRASFWSVSLQNQIRFALKSPQEQSKWLAGRLEAPKQTVTPEDRQAWLAKWEQDLIREQQMLLPEQPLAKQFWERRVAAFHQQKKRLEAAGGEP